MRMAITGRRVRAPRPLLGPENSLFRRVMDRDINVILLVKRRVIGPRKRRPRSLNGKSNHRISAQLFALAAWKKCGRSSQGCSMIIMADLSTPTLPRATLTTTSTTACSAPTAAESSTPIPFQGTWIFAQAIKIRGGRGENLLGGGEWRVARWWLNYWGIFWKIILGFVERHLYW